MRTNNQPTNTQTNISKGLSKIKKNKKKNAISSRVEWKWVLGEEKVCGSSSSMGDFVALPPSMSHKGLELWRKRTRGHIQRLPPRHVHRRGRGETKKKQNSK
ncbi:hypothetical protein QQF64_029715 [Cirrhinus molitorella]|uniref:Uncharacterized protein n=1 Tax=Cirrhinus molitorella TaxID=172907 RepID=A0ABR3N1B7_9TELE